jgi:hypothetical protein
MSYPRESCLLRQDQPRFCDTWQHSVHGNSRWQAGGLDAGTGRKRWDVKVVDYEKGYSLTLAPLVIRNKIYSRTLPGVNWASWFHRGLRCRNRQGALAVQDYSRAGRAGNETWKGDSWMHGGASSWLTGSY